MENKPQPTTWWQYLQNGLQRSRKPGPETGDRIAGSEGYGNGSRNLQNIKPFVLRHWTKAVPGIFVILASSALALAQPLVTRSLIDDAILAADLRWLAMAIGLMVILKVTGMACSHLQGFYFARFEQTVSLDIQESLLGRTMRFPTSFFDDKGTGYLMSRLTSDVQGVRLFFSSYLVHIATSALKLIGGLAMIFYLEWRLALVTLLLIPGLGLSVRYF
jgi:ABC-type bacteriocin/lantibiotic exporter with double-glycine peptidase domain